MDRQKARTGLQEWLFEQMVRAIRSGRWKLRIWDFRQGNNKSEHDKIGLCNWSRKRIYLHPWWGTTRVLVHELGHAIFKSPRPPRTSKWLIQKMEWRNERFEYLFFHSMTRAQRRVFAQLIRKARRRYARKLRKRS